MFDSIRSVDERGDRSPRIHRPAKGHRLSRSGLGSPMIRPGVLFMPYSAGQIAALRSTISAWMRLAIFEAMDRAQPAARGADPNSAPALVRGG